MECAINETAVHYVERGAGLPVVALHGAGVDHREIEAAIEGIMPEGNYRRVYPDLPGMGRSTAGGIDGNDDVVALLGAFIDRVVGQPVALLGHSYGAYLARGVAAQRADLVLGLALLCPVGEASHNVPAHQLVRQDPGVYDELDPTQREGFDEYFVVRTRRTARRYRDCVVPGKALADEETLGRIFARWSVEVGAGTFGGPTLITAGRGDSVAGYRDAAGLLERYPHATLAVIDGAGHALMHERPDLFAALVGDWLERSQPGAA